eukprot:23049_1
MGNVSDALLRCSNDHLLEPFQPQRIGHICAECKVAIHPLADIAAGCRICNFDLCRSCVTKQMTALPSVLFNLDRESLFDQFDREHLLNQFDREHLLNIQYHSRNRPMLNPNVSYHNQSKGVFGCVHYARNCWIKPKCCDIWYVCRHCHDTGNHHQMDRYSIEFVKCMRCGTEQKSSKYCIKCKIKSSTNETEREESKWETLKMQLKQKMKANGDVKEKYCFARYYCEICNLYDDAKDKEIFHCSECRVCKLGNVDLRRCNSCKWHSCVATSKATMPTQRSTSNTAITQQKYDEDVVQQLIDLQYGSREQCIEASSMVCDCTDINAVIDMLDTINEAHAQKEYNDLSTLPASHRIVSTSVKQLQSDPLESIPTEDSKEMAIDETEMLALDSSPYLMITESAQFKSLKNILERHEKNVNMEDIDIESTYNDFLYLVNNYSNDEQFEYIYNQLGECCDTNQCPIFARNYRDRTLKNTHTVSARSQILDKIHCFYKHTFDMRYKLTAAQRKRVDCDDTYEKASMFDTKRIVKAYRLTSGSSVSNYIPNKFKSYVIGQSFFYDDSPELDRTLLMGIRTYNKSSHVIGKGRPHVLYKADAKYQSLKDELTQNTSQHLIKAQWDAEYEKAVL